MSRGGVPQLGWFGIVRGNPSLRRAPRPYFSVRIEHLGHLGIKVPTEFYGDMLTWDQLGSLDIPWGTDETLLYGQLEVGWSYVWNFGRKTFTVTDDTGTKTIHENIVTISQLGICWDIVESHQFKILLDGSFENDAFLLAWVYKYGYPTNPNDPVDFPVDVNKAQTVGYFWSLVEEYLNRVMHSAFSRLLDINRETGSQPELISEVAEPPARDSLLARTLDLSSSGAYPADLRQQPDTLQGAHEANIRQCELYLAGSMLLIRLFASLQNASGPVLEPWLLWELVRWLGKSSIVIPRDNRGFDLSPWWG